MSKLSPELFARKRFTKVPHNQIFIFFKLQAKPNKLRYGVSNETLHELVAKVRVKHYQAGDTMKRIAKQIDFCWVFNGFISIDKRDNPEKYVSPKIEKESKLELGIGELWSPIAWIDNHVIFLEDTILLEITSSGMEECGLEPSTFMFHASLVRKSSLKQKKTERENTKRKRMMKKEEPNSFASHLRLSNTYKLEKAERDMLQLLNKCRRKNAVIVTSPRWKLLEKRFGKKQDARTSTSRPYLDLTKRTFKPSRILKRSPTAAQFLERNYVQPTNPHLRTPVPVHNDDRIKFKF